MSNNRYWSPVVAGLDPYVPGEQPAISGLVKLNTNENPFPPSPAVQAAIAAAAGDGLRLYPDPESVALRQALAQLHGVAIDQVFVGNGSDEVLAHAFQALLKHDLPILFPDISYSFYPVYCGLYGIDFVRVPLADDFSITPTDYTRPNGGIIFPNPNAPTGRLLPLAAITDIAAANPDSMVIVDEAYVDFGGDTAIPLLARFANLMVVRTFSKSRSLAGLRVGYAIGHRDQIEALTRVKNSFNSYPLDRLAQAGALASIQDAAWFEDCRRQVIALREQLCGQLQALGFQVLPSGANFLFARHPAHAGQALMTALRERRILVRHFGAPRIRDFLRITIGSAAQCQALVDALTDILARRPG